MVRVKWHERHAPQLGPSIPGLVTDGNTKISSWLHFGAISKYYVQALKLILNNTHRAKGKKISQLDNDMLACIDKPIK